MDPLGFPVLAGTVLTEAVKFLFNRASAVLDRRAGRVPVEEPEVVADQHEPLQVQATALTDARVERITQAQGALRVYMSRPELLQGDDAQLREMLGRLRQDLEEIYGLGFSFGEEQRPRPGVNVSQHADRVQNRQIGVRSKGINERASVRVVQNAQTISDTGEQVGVEIEGTIG